MTNNVDAAGLGIRVNRLEEMKKLGTSIRFAREALGLSQDSVAAAAGISQGAVSRMERATKGIDNRTPFLAIVRVAQVLASKARKDGLAAHIQLEAPEIMYLADGFASLFANGTAPQSSADARNAALLRRVRELSEIRAAMVHEFLDMVDKYSLVKRKPGASNGTSSA